MTSPAAEGSLLERLRECRSEQENDTDLSTEVTAILSHAVHDETPTYSLQDIADTLATSGATSNLDALHAIPLLLGCEDLAAGQILCLLAESGNAKEAVISVQESLEKLLHDLVSDDALGEEKVTLILERLLRLYTGAIPRLELRNRTASETLKPLFEGIVPVIGAVGSSLDQNEGKTIVKQACDLLSCTIMWASQQDDDADLSVVKFLCRTILSSTLVDFSPCLDLNLAQQKFEAVNPRLFRDGSGNDDSENDALLQQIIDVALSLSYSVDVLLHECTTGTLTLLSLFLSRTALQVPSPNSILTAVFPVLAASLQADTCTDSCLNILLHVLYPSSRSTSTTIDPDFLTPLNAVLTPIICMSPDPAIRLIAFRTLNAFLSQAPPLERMSLLRELLTESPFPPLRVAVVGLLKEAVLEALAGSASAGVNPFASPAMLRMFGYIVLRSDPPVLFSQPANQASLESFLETQEPRRLVECLAFYYVLLMRDIRNLTGVRDPSQVNSVEREFLSPLRDTLHTWAELDGSETVDGRGRMDLAALETNLERIEEAYEKLNLRPS